MEHVDATSVQHAYRDWARERGVQVWPAHPGQRPIGLVNTIGPEFIIRLDSNISPESMDRLRAAVRRQLNWPVGHE